MLRNLMFIACVTGLVAGVFASVAQEVSQVPLILEAETYENSGVTETASDVVAAPEEEEGWAPEDGLERRFYTFVTNIIAGIGFALVLVGAYSLWNKSPDWRSGMFWGLAGYTIFVLAPSLGLDPELPGTSAAELSDRQIWWTGTVLATGIGLGLIFLTKQLATAIAGAVLIALPHILGAPHPEVHSSLAPQALVDQYVVATLVTGYFFWIFLGSLSGFLFRRYSISFKDL